MLRERLGKEMLLFDGAMGSMLQQAGMPAGAIPEELNIDDPALIERIHREYLRAGADFLTTNTFGCNALKMKESRYDFQDMIRAGADCARRAIAAEGRKAYVALDIGPIGQLMEPMGTLKFDEAYTLFQDMINCAKDKVDVILFETMSDLYEVKAGVLAAKENCDLPVFVSMTYERSGRTLSGCDPQTMVNVLEGLGVDALGVNCSLGPDELSEIMEAVLSCAHVPVLLQPNAGLPHLECGKTCYALDAEQFAQRTIGYAQKGVSILGGCCGTPPAGIAMLRAAMPKLCSRRDNPFYTIVSSGVRSVRIGERPVICGERLNPTGKKKLKQALLEERYEDVLKEGVLQDQAGAQVLDVNVGVPGIDERVVMPKVIAMLQGVLTLPLQIDTGDAQAMEAACRRYNGRPLMNSVNGKRETMEQVFPIVKKYGGVVIGLTLDEDGIPPSAQQRFAIAERIIETAASYGIPRSSIIIDTLVLTASAQQAEVIETIRALRMVRTLGVAAALGVSNVSFGLPQRPLLNRTFLVMALSAGLSLPIINPLDQELMAAIDAFNVLCDHDHDAMAYIAKHAQEAPAPKTASTMSLQQIILHGLKDEVEGAIRALSAQKAPLQIINEILIPALDQAGALYEQNRLFLPQLMQCAETSKKAFAILKESFANDAPEKGIVMMATVEGDIHDIGKNIVKVVVESYGYRVIDLGKDVKAETVVEAFRKYHPQAIGLSALMTTTLPAMEKTIRLLRQEADICPIWVGGAVLNEEYARTIHADHYTADAMATVELLERIIPIKTRQ